MKELIFSVLLFAAPAAFSGETPAAPAATPPSAQKPPETAQVKYSADITQTMKNLAILMQRSAEVPPARLDALAREMARFNSAVKDALGSDILADVARKEKETEDKERARGSKQALQDFRAALQVYYVENNKYPKTPAALVPESLQSVPELYLPGHDKTAKITVIDSKKYDKDFSKAVTDSGGWLYFSNPESANYGLLAIDCSHQEPGGTEFFKY